MKNTIISAAVAFVVGTSLGYIITPTEVVEEIPESVVETVYEGKCGKAKYCIEVKDNSRTLVFNKGKESEWRLDIPYTEREFSNDDINDLIEDIRADKKLKVSRHSISVNMKARVDTNEIEKEMEKTKRYMDAVKRINELEEELEQHRKRKSNKVTAERAPCGQRRRGLPRPEPLNMPHDLGGTPVPRAHVRTYTPAPPFHLPHNRTFA